MKILKEIGVGGRLLLRTRREILQQLAPQYQQASPGTKRVLLDDFTAITGYHRRYAQWLLNHVEEVLQAAARPHQRYGPEVQRALVLAWDAANRICAKRLIPFLPTLIEALERQGHLLLTETHRSQLLSMIAATADRLLHAYRQGCARGLSTIQVGTLLKSQISIRTFREWEEAKPGFLEAERARPLWHPQRGELCVHPDADRHRDRLDGMSSAPAPHCVKILLLRLLSGRGKDLSRFLQESASQNASSAFTFPADQYTIQAHMQKPFEARRDRERMDASGIVNLKNSLDEFSPLNLHLRPFRGHFSRSFWDDVPFSLQIPCDKLINYCQVDNTLLRKSSLAQFYTPGFSF